jgi:hypothetical protein
MRRAVFVLACLALAAVAVPGGARPLLAAPACPLFGADNPWNQLPRPGL